MFSGNASMGNVSNNAQDIFLRFRKSLDDLENFSAWLTAQTDTDLGTSGLGFTSQDITFLRSATADLMALRNICYNSLPPGAYPQPSAPHDYMVNVKQVIGPM